MRIDRKRIGVPRLIDLMPLGKWVAIERELNHRSGLNASVFDPEGLRITDFVKWANHLCPAIKADKKGQTFICSLAHQNLAAQAEKTGEPVIGECDAGLVKLVVPIFLNGHFLGTIGGCGLLDDHGEVDAFLVGKTTDLKDADIDELSSGIGQMSVADQLSAVSFLEEKRNGIIGAHEACDM